MTATQAAPAPMTTSSVPRHHDAPRTWLALLAAGIGILPLEALFRDSDWLLDAWFAMAIVITPAALLRRRRPASALQVWIGVALLVPWLTLRFAHQHAIAWIIPGPGTWHDIHTLMTHLHHTTANEVAPVHSSASVDLVLAVLLGLVAALIDLTAVVGRHGALAGVPLLVVFTISGAVPRRPVPWPLFIFSAVAFLILLGLESRDDLQRWGHYVPRSGQAGRRAAGALSAQRIAAVSVVLALIVPVFVQSDSKNLIANLFHNGTVAHGGPGFGPGGTGGIDPFVALRGQLVRNKPVSLVKVQVKETPGDAVVPPFYLRSNVLSLFTGNGWEVGPQSSNDALDATSFEGSPGTPYSPDTVGFQAQISVTGLDSDPPVFNQPRSIDGLTLATRWNSQDQILIGGTTNHGQQYDVDFEQPNPSISELEQANQVDPDLSYWLQLPKVASSVHTLVDGLITNATTQYAKARAINNFFTNPANGFQYSLTTSGSDTGDALVDFLHNRIGYCQQYAAAMAVMLRLAGVPSRVVLGYTHPTPDKSGDFTVTTDDAHAWVEAYFSGIGWVPFDPTPLAGITGGAQSDLAWAPHGSPSSAVVPIISAQPSTHISDPRRRQDGASIPAGTTATSATSSTPDVPAAVVGGIAIVLIAATLTPLSLRTRRRRRRLARARHGDTAALWAELSDTATDLGLAWSDARSPRQVATWLQRPAGSAGAELVTLTQAVERAQYARDSSGGFDGADLTRDFAALSSQLRAGRTWGDRLRARLLPTSLGWTAKILPRRRH